MIKKIGENWFELLKGFNTQYNIILVRIHDVLKKLGISGNQKGRGSGSHHESTLGICSLLWIMNE